MNDFLKRLDHGPLGEQDQRQNFLNRLFDSTAPHYDQANALMAFGFGAKYRRDALVRAGLGPGMEVLDVATGTGAVAREALRLVAPTGHVVGVDLSHGMLRQALSGLGTPMVQGIAERLPVRTASVDFLSMGYALRHVADLQNLFAEFSRVLRPGGSLLILDFAKPRSRPGYQLARLYLHSILPRIVQAASRSREVGLLWRYCWETIERSVPMASVEAHIVASGFLCARAQSFFGVLSEYVGHKPAGEMFQRSAERAQTRA